MSSMNEAKIKLKNTIREKIRLQSMLYDISLGYKLAICTMNDGNISESTYVDDNDISELEQFVKHKLEKKEELINTILKTYPEIETELEKINEKIDGEEKYPWMK